MKAGPRKWPGRIWGAVLLLAGLGITLAAPAGRSAPSGRRKPLALGPVVQHVTSDSATIMWGTGSECLGRARLRPSDGETAERKQSETGILRILHHARFRGLRPDTHYQFDVRDCTGRWHWGSFRTAVTQRQPFTFLVYGDCRSRRDRHLSVVESMLEERAAFAVNTGDMVQDGAKLRLWYQFFRIERPLMRRLPVYPVLGNHELQGSWKRGVAAFRRYFTVPANGPEKGVTYSFVHGNSLFLVLNSNASFVGTTQTAWARAQLEAASSNPSVRHIFVFLHHSPYASGMHGENDDARIAGLPRMLAKYGVDALFAGHDHVYERGEADGLRYVISGGCGAPLYPRRKINDYTSWFESTTHFVRVTVRGDEVEYAALRPGGSLIDSFRYVKQPAVAGKPHRFVTLEDSHPRPMTTPEGKWPRRVRAPTGSGFNYYRLALAVALMLLGLGALYFGRRYRR